MLFVRPGCEEKFEGMSTSAQVITLISEDLDEELLEGDAGSNSHGRSFVDQTTSLWLRRE